MNYNDLRHAVPAGLRKPRRTRVLTPKSVLLFFLVETILFLLFGGVIQMSLGMGGVAITELAMLGLSVGFVRLMRADWRTVFPIRRPKASAIAGCAVLWAAATLAVLITNVFLMYLFPDPYQALSDEDILFQQVPFAVQILVVAILPAICEEALHRGVLQCGIGNRVKNVPLLTLIMGGIFAVFHLYPIKYPAMLILGGLMTYILAVTGNMVYSSFVHFLNNLMSLLLDYFTPGIAEEIYSTTPALDVLTLQYVGVSIMLFGTPVPILWYVGKYLLKRSTAPVRPSFLPAGERHPVRRRIIIPSVLIFLFGLLVSAM